MAYPYNSYQNPYQYYPVYQQPQYQQPQQPVQQSVQQTPPVYSSGIIWVSGLMEAQAYPIAPNNAVALWAKDGKTIYLKQADATGKPTMTVYDLVERAESASNDGQGAGDKSTAYATKDELSAVVGVVKGFDELIGSIKSDIDTMKTDMYGAVSKRRVSKKAVEAAEDDE